MPHRSSNFRLAAAAAAAMFLLAGCITSNAAPEPSLAAPHPVRMERVTGAKGEQLGWVRTDKATENGGTYEVILDQDMKPVGYTTTPGYTYRPSGGTLEPIGTYDRHSGLAHVFGRRPEDIVVTEVSTQELAASGPIGAPKAAVTLGKTEAKPAGAEDKTPAGAEDKKPAEPKEKKPAEPKAKKPSKSEEPEK